MNCEVGIGQHVLYTYLCFNSASLSLQKLRTTNSPPPSHQELAAFLHHWHYLVLSVPRNFTACLTDGISWQSLINMGHHVLPSGDPQHESHAPSLKG